VICIDRDECYRFLGLSPGADFKEVKCAYKNLVKKYHADRVLHIEDEELRKAAKELFEEKMRQLNKVYEILSSPSSGFSSEKKNSEEDDMKRSEADNLDRTCTEYFKQKESELFQKTFEHFKQKQGFSVYSKQKTTSSSGPRGQIFDFFDEENPVSPFDFIEEKETVKPAEQLKPAVAAKHVKGAIKPVKDTVNTSAGWKEIVTFLFLVCASSWLAMAGLYLAGEGVNSENYNLLRGIIAFCPVMSVILTHYIYPNIKFRLPSLWRGTLLHYLMSWIIVFLFVIISFLFTVILGSGNADLTFSVLKGHTSQGFSPARQFLADFILASSFFLLFSTFLTFGSEYAWRGFLFVNLIEKGKKKALLLTGLFCGIWALPLVFTGYYNQGYSIYWQIWTGEPYWYITSGNYFMSHLPEGVLMKLLFSVLFGLLLSWIYLKTNNILTVCLSYGVFEQMTPLGYLIVRNVNPLTGGPEGLTGIVVLAVIVMVLYGYDYIVTRNA